MLLRFDYMFEILDDVLHPINVNLNQIAQSYIEKMSSKSIKNANKVTLCNTCANKNVIKIQKEKSKRSNDANADKT